MKKLIVLQTVTPDYRKKLFLFLKKELKDMFKLYGGEFYFERSVKSDNTITFKKPINNVFFLNRKILFQFGMWLEILKSNVMVIELNPRIISNWIILFIRRVLFRKTILWGHAWPRNGRNSKSDIIRGFMRNIASEIIVYTKSQQIELQERMKSKKIRVAPNSVYQSDEMITHINEKKIEMTAITISRPIVNI